MNAQIAQDKPLQGLKVLDITHMLAGPYCTWMLGLMGADVIKVERPGEGDFARAIAPFRDEESLYFMSVNRNKRSITLNLKTEEGKQILRDLIVQSDILVENNRAGVMDRLGLGYQDACAINPRLIYASISGYGQTGPYRHKPAFDVIAQAVSGMMSITGQEGGPPARVGVSIGDIASGLFAAVAVLAAVEGRHKSGEGAFVDVSMMDCQLALMENAVSRYLNAGEVPVRLGSRHPLIAPFQSFNTADQPIAICVDTEPQWHRFCHALGVEALLDDPRFADGPMRAARHAELEPLLNAVFSQGRRDDFLERLEAADVPCSPINSIPEVTQDPQVAHRQVLVEVPEASGIKYVGAPFHYNGGPVSGETAPPALGAHSEEILAELGLDNVRIAELRRNGVL
ncbi:MULTISPECIES: CaiB/BaiF CoA transferase family protein [Achromobacter]|uniref:CaiB/BaiF CoA-transferase family protein n=1 Tax=Achromobacter spanius TaxID=217203 RepID=A0ABY8GLZ6_9BURK|nr:MULTISPECIES: CaiB/BaiF CoA-transferase family protein [Achromobacter]WAI85091.1 CoA transferase [Achromobacter spanius]WEX95173.1 CoA transferase [Achromobacter sp. SS2-2022]WFP05656.1 CaiB/BaiF CoA-transferase family protein [Achromobacter spanius]